MRRWPNGRVYSMCYASSMDLHNSKGGMVMDSRTYSTVLPMLILGGVLLYAILYVA